MTSATTEALVITAPEDLRGQRFLLDKSELSIGRAANSDVRLENPYVSRRHAVLRRAGSALVIEDLGSSGGLLVNGVQTREPALLHGGDRIRVGEVELELLAGTRQAQEPLADQTMVRAAVRDATPSAARGVYAPVNSVGLGAAPAQPAVFEIPSQRSGVLSNVAGDQYNNSVSGNQYNLDALRLDPMRRRARWVMRTGLAMILFGFLAGVVGAAVWDQGILHCISNQNAATNFSSCVHPAGFAAAGVGSAAFALGVIAVIASLFMRREVRRREAQR